MSERLYLQRVLDDGRKAHRPTATPSQYFEIFSAEQILKKYDPSDDEIDSGIVGKGGDGGIDSIYCYLDRFLLREDTSLAPWKKGKNPVKIELVIVQSRSGGGSFDATVIDKLMPTVGDLFDVAVPLAKVSRHYNAKLLSIADRFRKAYLDLALQKPALTINFYYSCMGEEIHPDVTHKRDLLLDKIRTLFPRAVIDLTFIGAQDLLNRHDQTPPTERALLVPKMLPAGEGYICLVPLKNFFEFITDEDDGARVLATQIFESNVRDYQGNVKVNSQIHDTLLSAPQEDFWWLNNGITVLASDVHAHTGERLIITDPQIVNGLQTSREIYRYLSEAANDKENRHVLIRVVKSGNAAARDRIIKATNSQTVIPDPWLHATEATQRRIEEYFLSNGLYYDRRKNFYKNQGKEAHLIVTIPRLAQAVISVYLQEPDNARARPSTVLKRTYTKVFRSTYPPELYLKCAQLLINTKTFLYLAESAIVDRNNLEFHLAMCISCYVLNTSAPTESQIATMPVPSPADPVFEQCRGVIRPMYEQLGADDKAAKGPEFTAELLNHLRVKFGVIGDIVDTRKLAVR